MGRWSSIAIAISSDMSVARPCASKRALLSYSASVSIIRDPLPPRPPPAAVGPSPIDAVEVGSIKIGGGGWAVW